MKKIITGFLFALSLSASAQSVQVSAEDLLGDVHHNITGICRDLSTDMTAIEVDIQESVVNVKMQMSKDIIRGTGYREYYFWVGATPSKKQGYQPYDPYSVAWPDFYATNRVFLSFNANRFTGKDTVLLGTQDCLATDCIHDTGILSTQEISYTINGKTIEFNVPRSLLPLIGSEKNVKFGFTTYYEMAQCNGEDDYPNWGEKSLNILLK